MSNITEERLAPCPFCGDSARPYGSACGAEVLIACHECGCQTQQYEIESEARHAWNRRASAPVLSEGEREALEAGATMLATHGWHQGESTPQRMMAQAALLRAMAERGK